MSPAKPAAPPIRWTFESSFQKLRSGMRSVGLKVLKNRLAEYVRLAAGGETILVTDRDRVVAELIPPREGRAEWVDDAQLAALVRQGLMTPPLVVSKDPPPRAPMMSLKQLLADLDADRADRF